jgi:hypothetical protein
MSWGLAVQVGELKARVEAIERELSMIRHWALRFAILVALWVIAIAGNLNAEQIAQILVAALKS